MNSNILDDEQIPLLADAEDQALDPTEVAHATVSNLVGLCLSGGALTNIFQFLKVFGGAQQIAGSTWDGIDIVGGLLSAAIEIRKFDQAKRHKKEKVLWIATDLAISAELAVFIALSYTLKGAIAASFSMGGGFGLAIASWTMMLRSLVGLQRAVAKKDPIYFIQDRLEKIDNLVQKKKLLHSKDSKDPKIQKKLKKIDRSLTQLKQQAVAMYKVKTEINSNFFEKLSVNEKTKIEGLAKNDGSIQGDIPPATEAEKELINHLENRQAKKIRQKFMAVCVYAAAAIGMTLIAAGVFYPPLIIPGIVFYALAGALKSAEISFDLFSFVTKLIYMKKMKNEIYQNFDRSIDMPLKNFVANKELKEHEMIEYHVAFEQDTIKNETTVEEYYQKLKNNKNKDKILNQAMKEKITSTIFKEKQLSKQDFSENNQEQIITTYCRDRVKQRFYNFFRCAPDSVASPLTGMAPKASS